MMQNPFLTSYATPHGTVPFQDIRLAHYEPALREGMRQEAEEIAGMVENPAPATRENT